MDQTQQSSSKEDPLLLKHNPFTLTQSSNPKPSQLQEISTMRDYSKLTTSQKSTNNQITLNHSTKFRSKLSKPTQTKTELEYEQRSKVKNYARSLILASTVYFTGFNIGIMNPMGEVMGYNVFKMKTKLEMETFLGNANLFLCMGAMVSYFFVGPLADMIGRIRLLILVEVISLLAILGYLIESVTAFYFVRMVSGLVIGILDGLVPITLSELFPSSITGVGGLFCYFLSTLSMVLGWLTPYYFDQNDEKMGEHYKLILMGPGAFGLPLLIVLLIIFKFGTLESPVYFLNKIKPTSEEKRRRLSANLRNWLGVVYTEEDTELKIEELIQAANPAPEEGGYAKQEDDQEMGNNIKINNNNRDEDQGMLAMFRPRYRFRFMVVVVVNIAQQLSGINYLIFLSTQLFDEISNNGNTITLLIGAMNILGGVVGIFTISKLGRRFNLISGVLGQIFGYSMLILGYKYKNNVISIIAVFSYMMCFAWGLGGTMAIFCAEIVPAAGVGIGGSIQWMFTSILGKVLPVLNISIGPVWILLFFIVMMIFTLFFINYACIETLEVSMDDVEKIYRGEETADGKSHHFKWFKIGCGVKKK